MGFSWGGEKKSVKYGKRTCNVIVDMLIYKCPKGRANKFQSSVVINKNIWSFLKRC